MNIYSRIYSRFTLFTGKLPELNDQEKLLNYYLI